jgi:hypothetical protein
MVELTEAQGKDIVSAMKKLSETEDKKVTVQGEIAVKQIEYFRLRDQEISRNQQGLVDAIVGLSRIIARAYASRNDQGMASWPPTPVPNYDNMEVDDDNDAIRSVYLGETGEE